jgi:hypothetical protein
MGTSIRKTIHHSDPNTRDQFCFLPEALHAIMMSGNRRQNLQCHLAIELYILREIHLAHSAFANLGADFVPTKSSALINAHKKVMSEDNSLGLFRWNSFILSALS